MFTLRFGARTPGGAGENGTDRFLKLVSAVDGDNLPVVGTEVEEDAGIRAQNLPFNMDENSQLIIHRARFTQSQAQSVNRDCVMQLRQMSVGGAWADVGTTVTLTGSGASAGAVSNSAIQGGLRVLRTDRINVQITNGGADGNAFAVSNLAVHLDVEVI